MPGPPSRRSRPAPPYKRSLPSPPYKLSLPDPPTSESLPAVPLIELGVGVGAGVGVGVPKTLMSVAVMADNAPTSGPKRNVKKRSATRQRLPERFVAGFIEVRVLCRGVRDA